MAQLLLLLASFLSLPLLLVCSSPSSVTAANCSAPDRAALRKLASAFLQNSASTTAFVGWEGDECCSWHGVVCKSAGHASRVTKLLLSNKNLMGAIPIAVCSLSSLDTLDLAHNHLSGSIPMCLGQNLTNLRQLHLSDNAFNGSILPVSELPHLTFLDLSWNAFNFIPPFKAPRLQWLLLSRAFDFGMDPSIPVFTIGMPNLQHLDLSWNYFTSGTSNLSTSPLPELEYLDLSECENLSDEIPVTAIISHLPQLRTLLLNNTALASQGPQIAELLCGLKSLEVLSVAGNLDLNGRYLSGEIPSTCKSPSVNLIFLDLSHNLLSGPFPAWMSLFSNLQVLDLSGNNFSSSTIPPEWQNLTKLTILGLSGPLSSNLDPGSPSLSAPFLLPEHMQNWLFRLPLQTLILRSLGLTNQHIACSHFSLLNATLQSLDLSYNLLSDGHALQCLVGYNFTALVSLDLSHNALAFSLGHAIPPSLDSLKLTSCELEGELTDQFFGLLGYSTELVSLAYNYFSGTLPVGIDAISEVYALDLSHNNFTGPLPPSIGNLSTLMFLHLEHNDLEGEIPQELGNLSSLDAVFLGNNRFTKCLFTHTQSPILAVIDMTYNRLEGDLTRTFFGDDGSLIQNLVVLLLGHNRLTGALPGALNGTSSTLAIIELSNNQLTGSIPDGLPQLFAGLISGGATGSSLGGDSSWEAYTMVVKGLQVTYFGTNYNTMSFLDLSNNRLNGTIPESLGALSALMGLNLSTNHLTGNMPSNLANLSRLESLDLSHNMLQGPIPTSFSKLTKLAVFNVSFNDGLIGSIPTDSPQFQDNTSYIGDPHLCGEPILQICHRDSWPVVAPPPHEEHDSIESDSFLLEWVDQWIAIPGFCIGIPVGFLGVLWVLRFKRFV